MPAPQIRRNAAEFSLFLIQPSFEMGTTLLCKQRFLGENRSSRSCFASGRAKCCSFRRVEPLVVWLGAGIQEHARRNSLAQFDSREKPSTEAGLYWSHQDDDPDRPEPKEHRVPRHPGTIRQPSRLASGPCFRHEVRTSRPCARRPRATACPSTNSLARVFALSSSSQVRSMRSIMWRSASSR